MNDNTQAKAIRLDDLTSLHVSGDDAAKFLHAQFTNDLANLPVNSWQYSGYCTPKGRLLAFITIVRLDENEFLLVLPAEVSEKILPRLRMFVMRDDVKIAPQNKNTSITGIPGSTGNLPENDLVAEKENGKLIRDNNNSLLTLDYDTGRFLNIGESAKIALGASTNRNSWTLADIQAGIPAVVLATQEAFVPQMVNLDLIGAVNFKKGCYPGQEIVARVHYLGKIKQRMYVLETSSKEPARPGDKIYIAGEKDKAAGTVVQAAINDSTQYVQAVLQTKGVDENLDLRLASADGDKLTMSDQPYSVSDTEKEK
ncbi:MAG: hypothetical protein U9N50_00260 [Pseudomonadota bacterium]|nr:hypothetical protein [Pseudomonadota bacterium]